MAQRASGFGKPKLNRAEPQEIGPSAAAPEPPKPLQEQVRPDNSERKDAWQSASGAKTADSVSVSGQDDWPRLSLTDDQFRRAAPFLKSGKSRRGRTPRNNRLLLEGVLYYFRKGLPWRDLPPYFGKWNTVYRSFRRWCKRGVFLRLFMALAKEMDFRALLVDGTFVKVHQHGAGAPKGGGRPMNRGKRKQSA